MMAARLDSVCKLICEFGDWKVINLQLQKILYLAQMIYMGRNAGARLVDADFEAWDYGPVAPRLYHKARMFGKSPIENVFFEARAFKDDDPRRAFIKEICDVLLPKEAGELVDITHSKDGAWVKYYEPEVRGIRIPDQSIFAEYSDRIKIGSLTDN